MAQKGKRNFFFRDSAAVIRHADHGESSVTDFHRNRRGFGIDSVLQQLLHNGGRAFNYLTGCDLVDRILI